MDNERFQNLVLESFARLSQEITEFKMETSARFERLEQRMNSMEKRMDSMENKLDTTMNQTAILTEFRNETVGTLEQIVESVEFIKAKQNLLEEDLFRLRRKTS